MSHLRADEMKRKHHEVTIDEKPRPAVRDPSFRQYFVTHFGVNKTGRMYRLSFGNETASLPDGTQANVVQSEIIMERDGFEALLSLLEHAANALYVKCNQCGSEVATRISAPSGSGDKHKDNEAGPCPKCGAMTTWSDTDAFHDDGTPYEP